MTQTMESAAEIRAELDAARDRLGTLEQRHDAAAERERAARADRAAAVAADPGSYRPELAAEVDAAATEREALAEPIEATHAEIPAIEARLKDTESREAADEGDRLRAAAVEAWEALGAELMKRAARLRKLHDAAREASGAAAAVSRPHTVSTNVEQAAPGLRQLLDYLRPYLDGEPQKRAEEDRARHESWLRSAGVKV